MQLGWAVKNVVAVAITVANNITPTQMSYALHDHLKANEKIMPVYYARIEVNVYGGFVFTYSSQLDQVHGARVGIDFHND